MTEQTQLLKVKSRESDKELTAKALMSLKNRYSRDKGWSTFFEVSLKGHQADCIVFNIYPSRDFMVIGFEVKASRSDWVKELQNPQKADPIVRQCDEFYVVEARQGIVKKHELPKGWGLLTLKKTRLYQKISSHLPFNPNQSREFYARIVEKAYCTESRFPDSMLWEAEKRGYERGKKEQVDDYDVRKLQRRVEILDKLEAGDVKINEWDLRDVRRVRLALDFIKKFEGGYPSVSSRLQGSVDGCNAGIEKIKEAQNLIEDLKKELGMDCTKQTLS